MKRSFRGTRLGRSGLPAILLVLLIGGLPVHATAQLRGRPTALTVQVNQWPKYHYDLANTGFNPRESTLSPLTVGNLAVTWSFPSASVVISAPTVVNGVVYSGDESGYVFAIDAASGTQSWSHLVGGSPGDMSFSHGRLFVGTGVGHELYALDAATGEEQWSFQSLWPVDAPTVIGNTVYVATAVGELYAFRVTDGTQRWKTTFNGEPFDDLAYSNGRLFAGDDLGCARAFSSRTGSILWTSCVGSIDGSPAVIAGKVYVATRSGVFYALDPVTGNVIWSADTGSELDSSASGAYGMVFIGGSIDGKVYAFPQNCSTPCSALWSYQTGGGVFDGIVANGVVYTGSKDNTVYALDARTGAKLWSYSSSGFGWFTKGMAVLDGVLYAGSFDHNLYAFSLPSLP